MRSFFEPQDFVIVPPEFIELPIGRMADFGVKFDPQDEELVRRYSWLLHRCGKGKLYARAEPTVGGVRRRVYMHRLIARAALGDPSRPDLVVDHVDGDGLNNRRKNLRWLNAFDNRWRYARHKQ